jgi:hypothetical protein
MRITGLRPSTSSGSDDIEVVVDSSQAKFQGYWRTSNVQKASYGPTYRVTDRNERSPDPRTAQWIPSLPRSGSYTVSIWLPAGTPDRARAVKYRLFHADSVSEFVVDQSENGGGWKQLGREAFLFSNSGREFLELRVADVAASQDGSPLYIQADAVRFASPPPALSSAPVVASVVTDVNYVEISWEQVPRAGSFVLSRAVMDGPMEEIAELTGTMYLDLDIDGGASYTYSLAGINGAGPGPAALINVETPSGPPLQPVQGVTLKSVRGVPQLSWQPTRDAGSYLVERGRLSGGPFAAVAEITDTTFFDFSAPREAFYVIRSVNAQGPCALSSWQVNWRRASNE